MIVKRSSFGPALLIALVSELLVISTFSLVVRAQTEPQFASTGAEVPLASVSATPPPPAPINSLNLTLSPVTINLLAKPGQTVQTELKIRNNSSQAEYLRLSLGSFTADETGQRPLLIEPHPQDEFLNWITFDQNNFRVEAGEWKTVKLTFSPPPEAALAYYYTVIVNRSQSAQAEPGQTLYQGAPAFLVLATVPSPYAKQELQLTSFLAKHQIVEYLPQEFTFKVKNTGNIHLAPGGNLFIDGQGRKDVAILPLNPERSMVLPSSEREFTVTWDDGFPVYKNMADTDSNKEGQPDQRQLSWDFSRADKWRFGRYTAHILLVYDNGQRDVPFESSVTFWVLPWKIMLGVGSVVLLTGIGLIVIVKSVWGSFQRSR